MLLPRPFWQRCQKLPRPLQLRLKKLLEAAEANLPPTARVSRRLFVNDFRTGKKYLVDSGAELSVMPSTTGTPRTSDIVLTAANGTRIATYGPKTVHLDLGFPRKFTWTFEMADVSRPIIGADFLHYFGLLIRYNRLIDRDSHKTISACPADTMTDPTVFTMSKPIMSCFVSSRMSPVNHLYPTNFSMA